MYMNLLKSVAGYLSVPLAGQAATAAAQIIETSGESFQKSVISAAAAGALSHFADPKGSTSDLVMTGAKGVVVKGIVDCTKKKPIQGLIQIGGGLAVMYLIPPNILALAAKVYTTSSMAILSLKYGVVNLLNGNITNGLIGLGSACVCGGASFMAILNSFPQPAQEPPICPIECAQYL